MKSTIRKIPVDQIIPHPGAAQRVEGIDHRRVERMAADFKPHALGVLTVSQRDNGVLYALDGMHRHELCRVVGYDKPLACEVFVGLTPAQEAELFYDRNDFRQPSRLTRFMSRVAFGDPVAVDINRIVIAADWKIDPASEPGCVAAVEALELVYRNAAGSKPEGAYPEILEAAMRVLTLAWEWETTSSNGQILKGLGQLLGRFGDLIDERKLVTEMQATRPNILVGKAKALKDVQGGTVPAALAKILVSAHNNKRRTNLLPEWVWVR
jgi:hypothetical protein